MIDLQAYLEDKVCNIISSWDEEDIYAISFFVYANLGFEYKEYSNVTTFCISYNTERDCRGAGELAEERWNYAFWRQNENYIIDAYEDDEGMKILFDWYAENGIDNIGFEEYSACVNEDNKYIGKGPNGYYELLSEITAVAKKLQDSNFIKNKFGKSIPIIIHELECSWYTVEATEKANTHGEADTYFAALKEFGAI